MADPAGGRGRFTIDDFGYDDEAGTLTCPNELTRRLSTEAQSHLRRGLPRLPSVAGLAGARACEGGW